MNHNRPDFEKMWHAVSEENKILNKETDNKIWEGIKQKIKSKKRKRIIYWAAAALAPVFGLVFLIFSLNNEKNKNEPQIYSAGPMAKAYQLPDGSTVKIEANGTLILENGFGKKHRKIKFKGNGYFDIAKNAKKPFLIDTGDLEIKVLGTKFKLSESQKSVELFEGRVQIKCGGKTLKLMPGEVWKKNNGEEKKYYSRTYVRTYYYDRKPFAEAIKNLEQEYNVEITYPSGFAKETINGSFKGNLQDILTIISFPFDLKPTETKKDKIVLK